MGSKGKGKAVIEEDVNMEEYMQKLVALAAKGSNVVGVEDENNVEKVRERLLEQYEEKRRRLLGGDKLENGLERLVKGLNDKYDMVMKSWENRGAKKTNQDDEIVEIEDNVEGVVEIQDNGIFEDDTDCDDIDLSIETDILVNDKKGRDCHRCEDDDNGDETYVGDSCSSDTEENMFDEFEQGEEDIDGDDGGDEEYIEDIDEPVEQLTAREQVEASKSRPSFAVGMTFKDKIELKRVVDNYAITHGVKLRVVRSDKRTFTMVYDDGGPFTMYASTYRLGVGWQVKTLYHEHRCARVYDNPRASAKWLAEHFKDRIQDGPKFKIGEIRAEVKSRLRTNVSIYKCKRAKSKIMEELDGN